MNNYLIDAIFSLRPNCQFVMHDNDYSTIQWHVLEGLAPTQAEIDTAIEKLKADEIAAKTKAETDKAALLAKLGITAEEARLLLS
jgi:hypothetical protein